LKKHLLADPEQKHVDWWMQLDADWDISLRYVCKYIQVYNQSINRSSNQSINQPINQSTHQPINQSNQSINQCHIYIYKYLSKEV
jgi:hypothetical protein